jgi:hypothetical protein
MVNRQLCGRFSEGEIGRIRRGTVRSDILNRNPVNIYSTRELSLSSNKCFEPKYRDHFLNEQENLGI